MKSESFWSSLDHCYQFLGLVLACLLSLPLGSSVAEQPDCVRPGDEVWLVSSRCLPDLPPCVALQNVHFQVEQLTSLGWQSREESELDASLAASPGLRTIIYTHGNWMTAENARGRGSYIYRRVAQRAEEPIRFIIYSWPSQRDGRPIRDVYEKAERSNVDTYYYADLLSRLPAETPLGLLGFSFGGRVVCGGLHVASGGKFEGRCAPRPMSVRQVRLSLVAPAFDRTWLMPHSGYGSALQHVESLVNIYNSSDPVLRRFRFIDHVTSPTAAGFTGLANPHSTEPLQTGGRIRQYDCSGLVGSSHDEMGYYQKCNAFLAAIDNVLGK